MNRHLMKLRNSIRNDLSKFICKKCGSDLAFFEKEFRGTTLFTWIGLHTNWEVHQECEVSDNDYNDYKMRELLK